MSEGKGQRCPACRGSGVERHHVHGVWASGEASVEPIKCEVCDGFGFDVSELSAREFEQFVSTQITGKLL